MKGKVIFLVVLLVAAFYCLPAIGAEQQSAIGVAPKIAYVDLARALNEVEEGKRAKAALEKEFQTKKVELDGLKNKLSTLGEEMEQKSALLSQEAIKGKRDEYQKMFMDYQQKAKEYTEDLARKEGEMTGKIIDKLRNVVVNIAQRDGYTFVFEKSQGGVVYGPQNADITPEVIKLYNK